MGSAAILSEHVEALQLGWLSAECFGKEGRVGVHILTPELIAERLPSGVNKRGS